MRIQDKIFCLKFLYADVDFVREALPFLGIVEEESPDPLDTEKRGFQPFFFLLSGGGSVLLLDILGEGGGCLLAGVGVSERERIFLGSSLAAADGTTSMDRLESGVTGRSLLLPGGVRCIEGRPGAGLVA